LARDETQHDAWGEVVFAYAVAKLKVRLEHCAKREWDRLQGVSNETAFKISRDVPLVARKLSALSESQ
jgi:hypothetical protein